jgi:crotonobetainyl-CoA:carnitine CoA-transferase CaiB-like acyl-CoA transferase
MMPFAAPWMITHSIDRAPPRRYGNRHPDYVPNGVFRCTGDDNWIAIAVSDDEMWKRLCGVIGHEGWSTDPALRTAIQRRSREAEIESAIGEWASLRSSDEAMTELQGASIAAGAVRLPYDLLGDRQLNDTGFLQQTDRPFIGKHPQPSMPFRETAAPYPVRYAAPTLGEHNEEIFCVLLGLSGAELTALVAEGIVGTEMLTEAQIVNRAK